jgi:exosortase E/protease (VPEID-CTERM system)
MNPAASAPSALSRAAAHPLATSSILLVLVAGEVALLRTLSYGRYVSLGGETPTATHLLLLHNAAKYVLLSALLTIAAAFAVSRATVMASRPGRARHITAHLACLLPLLGVLLAIPTDDALDTLPTPLPALYLASSILVVLFGLTALNLFVAPQALVGTARRASLIALMALTFFSINQWRWPATVAIIRNAMEETTLRLALWFHGLMSPVAPTTSFSERGFPIFSGHDFAIEIHPSCAGYQGVFSAAALLAIYMAVEHRHLRVVRGVGLFIGALLAIFAVNAFRIALLFEIGVTYSAEVALGGFHSNFGTATLLVVIGLAMLALNTPAFSHAPAFGTRAGHMLRERITEGRHRHEEPLDNALWQMTPLALMLSAMFVAGLFVGDFNWLYPLHIAVGTIALVHFWPRIAQTFGDRITWHAPVAGVAIYLIWLELVPRDPERAVLLVQTLGDAPLWVAIGWILVRIIGSGLVVPILEELAFRGGLQSLLAKLISPASGATTACALSLCLTSLGFGLMHGAFVAATIAGLVYGLVALRRNRVGDAIIAHCVTNLLIAGHVIVAGDWSLW